MRTYCILRQQPGQVIPRPFNRASSLGEAAELLANLLQGGTREQRTAMLKVANDTPGAVLVLDHVGTDKPVFRCGEDKFFMFVEP